MMIRTLPLVAVALFALSACDTKPKVEEVTSLSPDPQAAELAKRAPVALPPSIKAEVKFRCNPGNSLVEVTFFNGDKQAQVKPEGGSAVMLMAPNAGEPYVAEGYSLTGDAKNVALTQPGKGALTCKA